MSNETTSTSFSDVTYAEVIEADIQLELRPHRIFKQFLRHGQMGPSLQYSFTLLDDAGNTSYAFTEGTTDFVAGTLTQFTTTASNATAAVTGVAALLNDLAEAVTVVDMHSTVTGSIARLMAESDDATAQAVIDGFSNSTGGATTNTIARLLTVISALEQRDVTSGRLVGGQHPVQVGDLRADVVGLNTTFQAGQAAAIGGLLMSALDGYIGDPFGVPTFQSTTITSSGGAYLGWVMVANEACGEYTLTHPDGGRWEERVETQRDASKVADEIICTTADGFALIDNNKLQGWKSTT